MPTSPLEGGPIGGALDVEDEIFLEENELSPNRYTANVTLISLPFIIAVWALNEFDVFHVNRMVMAGCCILAIICSLAIQPLGRIRDLAQRGATKYVILFLVFAETLTITTAMSQWTKLFITFPLILGIQYHSRKVVVYTACGSLIIAALSSPLSIYFGLEQVNYYEYLIRSIGYKVEGIAPLPGYDRGAYMATSFLYMSVPRIAIVTVLAIVSNYVAKQVSKNISNRAQFTRLSKMDVLTGLPNRMSYEEKVEGYRRDLPESLVCIYADADGLHELNNERGHDAGDEFLKICADALTSAFGDLVYRIGGDEFVIFTETEGDESVGRKVDEVRRTLQDQGYHVSMGYRALQDGWTIEDVVREAEDLMYDAKHEYYQDESVCRRKIRP